MKRPEQKDLQQCAEAEDHYTAGDHTEPVWQSELGEPVVENIGAEHKELAMRVLDDAHDTEDQGKPDRDQCVHQTEIDPGQRHLREFVESQLQPTLKRKPTGCAIIGPDGAPPGPMP